MSSFQFNNNLGNWGSNNPSPIHSPTPIPPPNLSQELVQVQLQNTQYLQQLEAQSQQIHNQNLQINQLQEQINQILQAQLQNQPPRTPIPPPTSPNPPPPPVSYSYKIEEPKAKDPSPFDGKKPHEAHLFIRSCQLVFALQPIKYQNEFTKVLYAISYLAETPLSYFQALYERPDFGLRFGTWELFKTHFLEHFGESNLVQNAEISIRNLRQTGSASSYNSLFTELSNRINWNDSALKSQFYHGLKKEIKDELAKMLDIPDSLERFKSLVISLDNRMFSRRKEAQWESNRSSTFKTNSNQSSSSTPSKVPLNSTHSNPVAMEVDATQKKFLPLTPEQKAERIKNGQCLYCGTKGHRFFECPKRAAKVNAMVEAVQEQGKEQSQ
jgi:hypothetical protein